MGPGVSSGRLDRGLSGPPAEDGKLPSLPFPVFQDTITGWLRALLPKSRRARLFEAGCQIGWPVPVCRVSISLNDVLEAHPLGYGKEKLL